MGWASAQAFAEWSLALGLSSRGMFSEALAHAAESEKFGGLTTRERDVARCLSQGKSNREIAEELVLSERTVEHHVGNVLKKLGFESRSQIAVGL